MNEKDPRTKLDAIIKEVVDKMGIPDVRDKDESEEAQDEDSGTPRS